MPKSAESARNAHKSAAANAASRSFAPLARRDARILVLGSLPGQRSLAENRYYAHPRNAFWRIMRELTGAEGSYERRCRALIEARVALWDVLYESVRPGSMDADIRFDTAQANDFESFFNSHPDIRRVCFNGRKAASLYDRLVARATAGSGRDHVTLPSTSPAYAAMPYADKLAKWRHAFETGEKP